MRTMPLQFLTWGTIVAAVGSAAWLSSSDQAALFCSVGYQATSQAIGLDTPAQPAHGGASSRLPGAGAAKQFQAEAG